MMPSKLSTNTTTFGAGSVKKENEAAATEGEKGEGVNGHS